MTSLSSQPYKGTRDYYPADKRLQNYIFRVWKTVAERYGYEEYGAPLLEPIEIYAAKSGQELVGEQTYQFTDRGERRVVIRPEMTPSISRMVAARRQEMAYPARLFNIANFMRYERPQRGREREFWQLNVDIFGADSIMADVEIIQMGVEIMRTLGAKDDMYAVKVNNRKVINAMMQDYLRLNLIQSELMIKLFDRKNKISDEDFRDQAIEIFGADGAETGLQKIAKLLGADGLGELPAEIKENEAVKEVKDIFKTLKERGITNLVFDITLMRGFDYYTGTVFEFFDNHPDNRRAMFGGGRYDGLVGLFGAEPISAVGMAPGLSMTEVFLQSHNLVPDLVSTTDVYMVVLDEAIVDRADKLAERLRAEGANVELDFTGRKLDKQIKTAIKKQVPFMLFVGEADLKKDIYNFKDTKTAKEEALSFERIVSRVTDRRRKKDDELLDDVFA